MTALPSFHNVRFPEDVSYSSSGGPQFNTTIIELASGAEQRNVNWSLAKASYDAKYGVKTREQMEAVLEFFSARRGKAYGFRFKDWMDFDMDRQQIGVTDGTGAFTLQVYKRYEPLTSYFYDRVLTRLVTGTIYMWVDGVPVTIVPGTNVNVDTGIVTGAGFGFNKTVEFQCQFDVPVRFDTDEIKIIHDDFELMSWPSVPMVELKHF